MLNQSPQTEKKSINSSKDNSNSYSSPKLGFGSSNKKLKNLVFEEGQANKLERLNQSTAVQPDQYIDKIQGLSNSKTNVLSNKALLSKINRTPGLQLTDLCYFDQELLKMAPSQGQESFTTTNPSVNINKSKLFSDNTLNTSNIRKYRVDNGKSMPPLNAIIKKALKTLRKGEEERQVVNISGSVDLSKNQQALLQQNDIIEKFNQLPRIGQNDKQIDDDINSIFQSNSTN